MHIKFEPLTLIDQQIEPLFKPEEFDGEFEIAEKYREKVLLWQFRAKKKINEFSKPRVTSPSLQTTLSQSQDEHFRIKVPKYHITRFYGDDASKCGSTVKLYDTCGMQPKAKHSLRAQAQLMRTETVETVELVKRCIFQRTIDKYSACVEVGKPIDENSACVEVGTTHKHLRRGEISGINVFIGYIVRASNKGARKKGRIFLNFSKMYKNALKEDFIRVVENLDGTVESTDTIAKLKTKIENSSTFESDPDFVKTLIQNCIDERVSQNEREVTSEQKIELAKLQLAKLEKEIELQLAKNKALSLNPAAKVEEKQFETNIENMIKKADHVKEIPITYGYTQDPFKNTSQNFKTKIKENYPQYHERENKNCYICGDSSHCARDCEKRFKPKESNDHIHNKTNVNTLKIESEKQNSDECANLQYVNIFVENQPVTALIDSGCQIPVLNSSLIRVQTPSEEIITLSSCFGEQRMVEVKPINISLNQQSPSLSVRTAISPTLTEEFIIHPSVYSEIEKLGHAKSDVLLSESGSSLSADCGVSFPNVSVSNVIENSSYDLSQVKNFNTRNDSSSLIKDYKCNKIKSTKLKLSIVREKCSDIVLCKKANGAMKTSSVEFISRSPNPLPMKSKHHRFVLLRKIFQPWQWKRRKKRNRIEQTSRTLQRKISMRSTKDQLVKKDVPMLVKQYFPVEPSGCRRGAFT
ncbi:phosphatase and actin regulator 2 [Trichonephila clavipes]|nr:phosphatase and actin regulator 2 [Trichonephila clavipes]